MTALLAGRAPTMVVPVPSVGRADAGVQGVPSEVAEQPVMVAILLPMAGWTGLPTTLVAPLQMEVVAVSRLSLTAL